MNDGIMYVWNVRSKQGDHLFTCAKQSTAEYLRDWCEADEVNRFIEVKERLRGVYPHVLPMMESRIDKFYVSEGEVIL